MKYSFFLGGYFNNSNQSEFIRDAILAYCQKVSPDFNSFMTEDHNTNHSIDLRCKSMDLFLYDRDLRHERVKRKETLILKVNDVQNNTHCSMSAMEIPEICMKYLFKVNINDKRTKSMTFFWCLYF